MRNIRIWTIALAVVVVFVMSAVAAASASATEMPVIHNKAGNAPEKTGFTGKSGESVFETKSGEKLTCKEDTINGKITGESTDEAEIKFKKCTAESGLLKCKTKGAAAEEIILKVKSELVWINEKETEPGEDLVLPETLTIECTGLVSETLKVKGSTICPISSKLSKEATLTCKESKGEQEPSKYYLGGKVKEDFTETEGSGTKTFSFEKSGLKGTDTLTFEEELEVV